jgi:light-regulated signal transduction histidine kinase (bacteriophytochrome)
LRTSRHNDRATAEFRVRQPDGELRWISVELHALFDTSDRGKPARLIGVTRDITEIKQAVEKVRRLNADLEHRVQQRTAELTAANEELESFAYAVSHDLRAPLRAMWGFCDVLVEDYGDLLPPEAREYLQHVIDGSRQLGEIVDGLLTLSRSTRGALRRDVVDVSAAAEKILREFARVEPERRVTWTIEPALRASGDSRMIDAVMRNLLGNAWKYTAQRSDAAIRVYSEGKGSEYLFCVEDNGAGFNMEHAKKLFQPFQRLHRQDEFAGLGIGLATVQRIVHRHGGTVSGAGAPNHGAVFRFSLPMPHPLPARSEEEKAQ